MKRLEFDKGWPLPDDVLLELGRMTALWPSLETTINIGIGKLMGYDQVLDTRSVIVLAHANFQQRIDIFESLCEQLAPEYPTLSDYKAVCNRVKGAQKARNKYAHNAITRDENGQLGLSYASARGTLKLNVEIVRINEIKEATAKIHEACCAVHSLVTGQRVSPIWERT